MQSDCTTIFRQVSKPGSLLCAENKAFRFVKIDPKTGMPSNNESSILETYILGSEPYNQNFNKLDMLGKDENNSISGTGGLLN